MKKFISHLVIFVVGGLVGMYWGVKHPNEASNLADNEDRQAARLKQAAATAKLQVLQKFGNSTTKPSDVQAEKAQSQRDLDDANAKLAK